jgi:ABC-type antimicrobial peptide transport system permease subunit
VVGAVGLPLLAALCLAASLAAGGRAQEDRILMLLGADRGQRTAIRCLLNGAVAIPAALLGAALGWLVARLLVPVFVLAPDGLPPSPPVLVVFRPWQGVLGVGALTLIAFAGPVLASLREPRRTLAGEGAQL